MEHLNREMQEITANNKILSLYVEQAVNRDKGPNDVFTGNYLCNWRAFTFAIITQGLK